LEEILYKQKPDMRENSFFFTLNGADAVSKEEGHLQQLDDFFFKCQCLWFSDLTAVDQNLYIVWKAVCVVTSNAQYFGLLQEMISWHFDLVKRERFMTRFDEDLDSVYGPEMSAYLLLPFEQPPDSIKTMLESIRTYKQRSFVHARDISIQCPLDNTLFLYQFPRSVVDLEMENLAKLERGVKLAIGMDDLQLTLFEYHFYLPIVLSMFSQRTFCKLLTAVLLERNVVVVDDNLAHVTSIIMALKTVIRPFNWCGSLVPIMPSGL
jgi:hypothetical protein